MKPEEYFNGRLEAINITDTERDNISEKHTLLRESLRDKLPVEDDFLTGSYARNTIIRPIGNDKFDVDFFLAFNKDEFENYELKKLLELVKSALDEIKNEELEIREVFSQNRSVGVVYDGNFQVDVVPAIEIYKDKQYKIYDQKSGKPINSNPKLHGEILTRANEETESGSVKRLVPIIKLLKSWKRNKCDYVKSFHLELLAIKILKDNSIESFSTGLTNFFSFAGEYLKQPCLFDPANSQNLIDAYLDEDNTRHKLLTLVAEEAEMTKLAFSLENRGDDETAIMIWKKIFEETTGDSIRFPDPSEPSIITSRPKKYFNV